MTVQPHLNQPALGLVDLLWSNSGDLVPKVLTSDAYFDTQGERMLVFPYPVELGPHSSLERSSKFYTSVASRDLTLWGVFGQRHAEQVFQESDSNLTLWGLFGQRELAIAPGTCGMVANNTDSQLADAPGLDRIEMPKEPRPRLADFESDGP